MLSKCLYLPNGGNLKTSKMWTFWTILWTFKESSRWKLILKVHKTIFEAFQKFPNQLGRGWPIFMNAYLERVWGEYENEAVELHFPVLRSQLSIC